MFVLSDEDFVSVNLPDVCAEKNKSLFTTMTVIGKYTQAINYREESRLDRPYKIKHLQSKKINNSLKTNLNRVDWKLLIYKTINKFHSSFLLFTSSSI